MALPRFLLALAAPLLLASCLLAPGKFTSSLDLRSDRSFRFAYAGEVILFDPGKIASVGAAAAAAAAASDEEAAPEPPESGLSDAEAKAIVDSLSKEAGYRSVEYLGENKFRVDYQTAGRLDHNFVYPVNLDAAALIPWIAVELRKDDTARVTAIAFGGEGGAAAPAPGDAGRFREGTFTLTTDAVVVMHNSEGGMTEGPERRIVWEVTPTTRNAPTALVAFSR